MKLPNKPRWLWRYLWGWTLLVLMMTWIALGTVAYSSGLHEAQEITDGHLKSTAEVLLRVKGLGVGLPTSLAHSNEGGRLAHSRYATDLHVVAWENDRLTWDTHAMADRLPPTLVDGYHTMVLVHDGEVRTWRAYVATDLTSSPRKRRVAVATDTARHHALALDMAEHIVMPAIVLFPLTALLLIWAIRRGLKPLNRLSTDMATLDVRAGQRLKGKQAFMELESTVAAVHHLVDQLQHQWVRERRFNADVAHELRTPLTSVVLQAHMAQVADDPAVRKRALKQLEADALRAANILTQLLDLARAEQSRMTPDDTVDLCALARDVCTRHQGLAHEWGQTLSLRTPDTPVCVSGQVALLELALRNLVDNALRHNDRGTQVELAVALHPDGRRTLSVDNDGEFRADGSARSGMGVGLTLVQRIADAQGAVLEHDRADAPFHTRFALTWPVSASR
jgi:two-component system, OmpR family, sensor histidine kinase QseC